MRHPTPRAAGIAGLAGIAVLAALTVSAPASANAHSNPLARVCGTGHGPACTVLVQHADGSEVVEVRDHSRVLRFTDESKAIRYFLRHAPHCQTVHRHAACIAHTVDSELFVGTRTVIYLGDLG